MSKSYPTVDRIEVGARIRELRYEHNMTIGQLCEELEVSEQTIDKYQRGLCYPTMDKMLKLAILFDTTIEAILVGNDARQPQYFILHIF